MPDKDIAAETKKKIRNAFDELRAYGECQEHPDNIIDKALSEHSAAKDARIAELEKVLELICVEVFYQKGDPPFICGIWGRITSGDVEAIEKDIDENPEEYLDKDGTYLFKAQFNKGQYGDEGRCEMPAHWELDLVKYEALPEAGEENKVD